MKPQLTSIAMMLSLSAYGQANDTLQVDTMKTQHIQNVTITSRRAGTRRMGGAMNGILINREELFKAACCNLGESFTTNPSVDVNYSDAATGAKQIRLLGLSGTYVQMLTENLPNFRGAAAPYSLDYVPGPWMYSIQVSKGASSVRNGYESITGQIDVEYLKPDNDEGVTVNLYGGTLGRLEANADANVHLDDKLSAEVLAHYQDDFGHHDINDDGFLDQPNIRQWNLQNRWKWKGEHYMFHGGISLLKEKREGGQTDHTSHPSTHFAHPYTIGIETNRYEGYMKHAFILDTEHGTHIAVMGNASMHMLDANYGKKHYGVNQKNAYAQLLFETNFTEQHNLSAGLSLNYDYLTKEEEETTPGIYAQYTYNLNEKVVAMAGLRADHSSRYGTFVTPRFHLKLKPNEMVNLRLSAGKGYRTVHALAENNYLLASGRALVIDDLEQESAWNYGISSSLDIPLFDRTLRLNAEFLSHPFHPAGCHRLRQRPLTGSHHQSRRQILLQHHTSGCLLPYHEGTGTDSRLALERCEEHLRRATDGEAADLSLQGTPDGQLQDTPRTLADGCHAATEWRRTDADTRRWSMGRTFPCLRTGFSTGHTLVPPFFSLYRW